jgi:hypothetical protein
MTRNENCAALIAGPVSALLALLALGSPLLAGEFKVDISGNAGTTTGGTCLVVSGKETRSHKASGAVPLSYVFSGDLISCAIQRKSGAGALRVTIKDASGRIVAESAETLPFGVIIAAGR